MCGGDTPICVQLGSGMIGFPMVSAMTYDVQLLRPYGYTGNIECTDFVVLPSKDVCVSKLYQPLSHVETVDVETYVSLAMLQAQIQSHLF